MQNIPIDRRNGGRKLKKNKHSLLYCQYSIQIFHFHVKILNLPAIYQRNAVFPSIKHFNGKKYRF